MFKTAECVSPKHPDKMCDRISDRLVDVALEQDPNARCAIEVVGGHGKIHVTGEIALNGKISDFDIFSAVEVVTGQAERLEITSNLHQQSSEIARGVDSGGAGDQGIMVGYACKESPTFMPREMFLARELCDFIYERFYSDGKTQVTLDEDNKIQTVVASFCGARIDDLKCEVDTWLENIGVDRLVTTHINPAGDWSQGGFEADAGLTGRKIIVDNYGPNIPVGGGAFSGKDATKVDRSAAYMARKIAVDLLHIEKAKEVTVKLAYAIGVVEPVMAVATIVYDAQEPYTREVQLKDYYKLSDFSVAGIIKTLELNRPQFEDLAAFGHFGRDQLWDKPF